MHLLSYSVRSIREDWIFVPGLQRGGARDRELRKLLRSLGRFRVQVALKRLRHDGIELLAVFCREHSGTFMQVARHAHVKRSLERSVRCPSLPCTGGEIILHGLMKAFLQIEHITRFVSDQVAYPFQFSVEDLVLIAVSGESRCSLCIALFRS